MIEQENSALAWFAVHSKSRHEYQVQERLRSAGIEAFLPTIEKLRKWKDRNKLLSFPLFPGYLFVHIAANQQSKLAVVKTKGVVRMLGSVEGDPEPVPDEQILALQRMIGSGIVIDPYPYVREGQRVRIKSGPLSGVEGVLVEKTGRHVFVLSVDILRQSTAVSIEANEVEAV